MKEKLLECNTCTRQLIEKAYAKSFCFRFFREPLKFLMRSWIILKRVNISNYTIKSPSCKDCNRFYKNTLKENSKLFIWTNEIINPVFDRYLEKLLGKDAITEAKEKARELTNIKKENEFTERVSDLKDWIKI